MIRASMRLVLTTIFLVAEILASKSVVAQTEAQPVRNVLLLYVDDLRPELNCYGKTRLITPSIDALAGRSLVFNKAYAQIPVCMPSRVSTLSGRYPLQKGQNRLRKLLPRRRPSLPGHFLANGYDTVSIGKVYHFNNDDPRSWTKRYTDTFGERKLVTDGWASGYQLKENLDGRTFAKRGRNQSALTEFVEAPDSAYPDGIVADNAIAEIRKHAKSGKPMFLAAGFYRPHLPWVAPKKYWDMYKREDIELAKNQFLPKGAISRNTWGDLLHYGDSVVLSAGVKRRDLNAEDFPVLPEDKQRELIHGYWACVSFVDAQIGRILAALDEAGMRETTMVVLLSDHGWQLGEHRMWSKCSNYEEAVRVPLMISAPGLTGGTRTDALVELVDIYPTVCEFAGLPLPDHLEGISMLPLLKQPSRQWKKAAFNIWGGARSMRTQRYRLTVYDTAMPKGGAYQLPVDGRIELYDYEADPAGNVNIAGDPDNKALLQQLMEMIEAGPKAARPDTLRPQPRNTTRNVPEP